MLFKDISQVIPTHAHMWEFLLINGKMLSHKTNV